MPEPLPIDFLLGADPLNAGYCFCDGRAQPLPPKTTTTSLSCYCYCGSGVKNHFAMNCQPSNHNQNNNNNIETTIQLANGVRMPFVGLGTSHSGGYSHSTVVYALKECDYRLVDTAKRYGTESFIREAIDESGIPRDELFLASKLWPTDYGYESAKAALRGSLKRLGTDYIDLFLIHWPEVSAKCADKWTTLAETWRALETLYDEGLCRAIGVSNYYRLELDRLLDTNSIAPHVNQIEYHPYQNPSDLLTFCAEHHIQIQGYCPLGKGKIVTEPLIVDIADRHRRSAAQVLIRWSLQNGIPTIPKSTKEHRVKENIGVFDFALSDEEMAALNGLHDGRRYIDGSGIREKIDSNLPDGYKLNASPEQGFNGHRRKS